MQLADLVAYRIFRQKMVRYRQENDLPFADDSGMVAALRGRTLAAYGLELPGGARIESVHESLFAMMQIAYASQSARHKYPELAAKLMIPIEQYHVSVDEPDCLTGFFPLFRPEIVRDWQNGKRPLL